MKKHTYLRPQPSSKGGGSHWRSRERKRAALRRFLFTRKRERMHKHKHNTKRMNFIHGEAPPIYWGVYTQF